MILKSSQRKVIDAVDKFLADWKQEVLSYETKLAKAKEAGIEDILAGVKPLTQLYQDANYRHFHDRPDVQGQPYPRFCIQVPTGGGKTLVAVETIRLFQENFLEKKTGMVLWIVHSEPIYKQTIKELQDKTSSYRQLLDQISGNRTIIAEKTDALRYQDIEENLVVLMLMIQSANRESKENLKVFKDSGIFIDFFPDEISRDNVEELLQHYPTLDYFEDEVLGAKAVKTSLGNVVRVCNPLFVVDEIHKIYSDRQREVLDSLNPRCIIGLSATPKDGMNVLVEVTGMELYQDELIKLPIHVLPAKNKNWRNMLHQVREKREDLERIAHDHKEAKGDYIRPIALLQAERTGKDKRDGVHIHADDVRDYLVEIGVPISQIAIKSSYVDELKDEVLLSSDCDIRYIITKQALMEGWNCPFAYVLGVIPSSRTVDALTQLVGRVLRQPYAKRTGVPELDQCYTYFNHQDSEELLVGIKKSLEKEGMADIVDTVRGTSGPSGQHLRYHAFPIQEHILSTYPESLALPLWHVKEMRGLRLLSYRSDILTRINWNSVDTSELVSRLSATVGQQRIIVEDYRYFLGENYTGATVESERESIEGGDEYIITQMITDYVGNPFVANDIVERVVAPLMKKHSRAVVESDFGYVGDEIVAFVRRKSSDLEQAVFDALVKSGEIVLAITKDGGYMIPANYYAPAKIDGGGDSAIVPVKADPKSLHLAVDFITMNSLEREIVQELKAQGDRVLWWMRNKVEPGAYRIQGWRRNGIYPDFVIAKQTNEGRLELVYILESKGDQLAENLDTKYKELVFQKMTEVGQSSRGVLREFSQYDFRLVPEKDTAKTLREMFA